MYQRVCYTNKNVHYFYRFRWILLRLSSDDNSYYYFLFQSLKSVVARKIIIRSVSTVIDTRVCSHKRIFFITFFSIISVRSASKNQNKITNHLSRIVSGYTYRKLNSFDDWLVTAPLPPRRSTKTRKSGYSAASSLTAKK